MAYIRKVIGADEQLIGIARLHWIYVVKGLGWFLVLAGGGWLLNTLISNGAMMMGNSLNNASVPLALMKLSNGAMWFLVAGGFFIFFLFVLKVLVTEIGLTSRRVMHKTGLIFVKMKQIDLEEIRGENMDLGHLGRLLGYGYLMFDCRFIGDVTLPAIENPERFLKALHVARSKTQDSVSVPLGEGVVSPVALAQAVRQQQPEIPQPQTPEPEIQPPRPGPEISPPQTPQPEIVPTPVPHGPPPGQAPQPEQPVQPVPQQPIPAPPPSEPPLQPPGTTQMASPMVAAQEIPQRQTVPPASVQDVSASAPAQTQNPTVDPKVVAQVMREVMPQMAQQVAKELIDQGMVEMPASDNAVDNDLIASFDEAALDEHGKPHDNRPKVEHVIH